MSMLNHLIKDFVVEVNNKVRHDAILDVCRKHDYNFDDCEHAVIIYAYTSPTELNNFFEEVDKREEELNSKPNIALTEEQKIVLDKVLDMLADANIGLCHDYKCMGQLMAFNSNNGKIYACDEPHTKDNVWYSDDDVIGEPTYIDDNRKNKFIYSFFNGGYKVIK